MSYRPSLHGAHGAWGHFLDQERRERNWSAVQAWEELHKVLGLSPKSTAVYKAIERGTRQVSKDEDEALRTYFGKGPSELDEEPRPAQDISLAAAIKALADELGTWRSEDRSRLATLERLVAAMAAERLSSQGTEGQVEPAAPQTTAG